MNGKVRYYFGGPVPDARVSFAISRSMWIPWYYRYWFGSSLDDSSSEIDTGEIHTAEGPSYGSEAWGDFSDPIGTPVDFGAALGTHAGARPLDEDDEPVSEAMEVEPDQLEAAEPAPDFLDDLPEQTIGEPLDAPPPPPGLAAPEDAPAWRPGAVAPPAPESEPPVSTDPAFDLEHAVAALEAAGRGAGHRMPYAPTAAEDEPAILLTDAVDEPAPAHDAVSTDSAWADLEDEIAEIRFFLEAELEDEAKEAFAALDRTHPGHPELAPLKALFEAAPTEPSSSADHAPTSAPSSATDDPAATVPGTRAVPETDGYGEGPDARRRADELYDQGMAYKQIGQLQEAAASFRVAAETSAERAVEALEMLGQCLMDAERPEEAIEAFERALERAQTEPAQANLRYEIGSAYERAGDLSEARAWFESCHRVVPEHRDVGSRLRALADPRSKISYR